MFAVTFIETNENRQLYEKRLVKAFVKRNNFMKKKIKRCVCKKRRMNVEDGISRYTKCAISSFELFANRSGKKVSEKTQERV